MLYSSGTTGRPKGIKPHLLPIQVDEPGEPLIALLEKLFQVGPDTSTCLRRRSTMPPR